MATSPPTRSSGPPSHRSRFSLYGFSLHVALSLLYALLGAWSLPAPTYAQVIEIRNGTVLTMSGGVTWDLEGSVMDFGLTSETARLDEQESARVTGGLLAATRTLNSPAGANPAGLGVVISSPVDLGATVIIRGHTVQTGGGNISIARYYDIAPTAGSDLDATLAFTYHDAELGGLAESSLELFRSTDGGTTWTARGYESRDGIANQITLSGIHAFSRWTLGSESSPLPVELTDFRAVLSGEATELTWRTASETNNAGFRVQRRVLGIEDRPLEETQFDLPGWVTLGFIEGAAGGTTGEPQRYRFVDRALPFGAERLVLHGPFPNPATGRATIRYELPDAQEVHLILYNVLGQRVATLLPGSRPPVGRRSHWRRQAWQADCMYFASRPESRC